jgi:ligand-binding SRPBCC domain-containing protein
LAIYKLIRRQQLSTPIADLWDFFSDPEKLSVLTPGYMNFRVTSGPLPERIYPGQIVTYKVSPLLNIPLFWMTEITHVVEQKLFIDEQRRGPYKLWHHQHHFQENYDGTLMTDIVHYELPLFLLGRIAHSLFVKKQLNDIFDFRAQQITRIFGAV